MAVPVRGMHHIGITVPDIEEGITFFQKIFGAVVVFRTGAFDVDDRFMEGKLGAAPKSRIKDLVFLRCGNGTSVELFEYSGEDKKAAQKRPSEVGGSHICFEVEDVFASAKELEALGVEMFEGPNVVDQGPLEGFKWVYFRAPWGQILEIASFDKLGYEKETVHRLWRAEN
jgi:catechol 2,3-dioxygenase-like lactoylglutathione lyase family enzyme